MESKLFNSGFPRQAPEDLAKYAAWGRQAGWAHVAKSVNQTHSQWFTRQEPRRGEPRSDGNRRQLEPPAGNLHSSLKVGPRVCRRLGGGSGTWLPGLRKTAAGIGGGPRHRRTHRTLPRTRAQAVCTLGHTSVPTGAVVAWSPVCSSMLHVSPQNRLPGPLQFQLRTPDQKTCPHPPPYSSFKMSQRMTQLDGTAQWVSVTVPCQHSESSRRLPCPP